MQLRMEGDVKRGTCGVQRWRLMYVKCMHEFAKKMFSQISLKPLE